MEHEFLIAQGFAHVAFQLQSLGNQRMHRRFVNNGAIFSQILRAVHRQIGVAQNVVGRGIVTAIHRNAHAGGEMDFLSLDYKRHSQDVLDTAGSSVSVRSAVTIADQDDKFIPTQPGQDFDPRQP